MITGAAIGFEAVNGADRSVLILSNPDCINLNAVHRVLLDFGCGRVIDTSLRNSPITFPVRVQTNDGSITGIRLNASSRLNLKGYCVGRLITFDPLRPNGYRWENAISAMFQ